MKIYDCFTFFNELDLLEIRLETLYRHIDYFVLVEMNKTHAGNEKPFYFEKNKKKFTKYLNKIIHIKITNPPKINPIYNSKNPIAQIIYKNEIFRKITQASGSARWRLEIFQRNQIKRALQNCNDDDIIMVSDVDEIPNPKKFLEMKKKLKENVLRVGFEQDLYFYYLNGSTNVKWLGTKTCYYKTLKEKFKNSPQKIRINRKFILFWDKDKDIYRIKNGGWHFSWIGGTQKIKDKLNSYAHIEDSTFKFNNKKIINLINEGNFFKQNIKIKYKNTLCNLPKTIKDNKNKYKNLIKKK